MNEKGHEKLAKGAEPKSSMRKRKATPGVRRLDNDPAGRKVKPVFPQAYTADQLKGTYTMTTTLGPNEENEINKLYYELVCHTRDAIHGAMQIGALLVEKKKQLPPDEWLPWLKNSVEFDETMAANYIAAYSTGDPFDLETIDGYKATGHWVGFGKGHSTIYRSTNVNECDVGTQL